MKRRLTTLLLALVMCLAAVPMNASAAVSKDVMDCLTPYDLTVIPLTQAELEQNSREYGAAWITFKLRDHELSASDFDPEDVSVWIYMTQFEDSERKSGDPRNLVTLREKYQVAPGTYSVLSPTFGFKWDGKSPIYYSARSHVNSEWTAYSDIVTWGEADAPWEKASEWATETLQKADDMGLIPDSLRGADLTGPITRKEFAAVAVKTYENLTGKTTTPVAKNPFTDTNDTEVLKAYNVGITSGTAADKFSPDVLLNREQAATMLTRVLKAAYITGWTGATDANYTLNFTQPAKFADDDKISDWAKPSVYFMAANGIISGTGNNMFSPRAVTTAEQAANYASATREQALVIAVRMVENLKGKPLDYKEGVAQGTTQEPTKPDQSNNSIVGKWDRLSHNNNNWVDKDTGVYMGDITMARAYVWEFYSDGTFYYFLHNKKLTDVKDYDGWSYIERTALYRGLLQYKGNYRVEGDIIYCTNVKVSWTDYDDSKKSYGYKTAEDFKLGYYIEANPGDGYLIEKHDEIFINDSNMAGGTYDPDYHPWSWNRVN